MIAAYRQYWRVNILTLLEYRANFVMWFGFTIAYHAVALGALYVTMHTFPSMDGWDFRQMFFLYALWMCGHELHNLAFFQVNFVPEYVRAASSTAFSSGRSTRSFKCLRCRIRPFRTACSWP
jgi:ABC-type uncharacterized transport system permease subunit